MAGLPNAGDEPTEVVQEPLPRKAGYKFDFDDAFSEDGEDQPMDSSEFTSAAIRKELAKNFRPEDEFADDDDNHSNGIQSSSSTLEDPNASISTIDMDAPALSSPRRSNSKSPASQLSHSEVLELQSRLENVSLTPELHEVPKYPGVVIEVPESPSSQVVVTSISAAVSEQNLESDTNISPKVSVASTEIIPASNSLPLPSLSSSSIKHRPTRSVGPSALEKFVSRTRPSFLPPKSKDEDNRHLADWEAMMGQSRVAEAQRRKALQERRLAREKAVEHSIEVWEREVLPDWKTAVRNPRLRKLWWAGVPPKLRPVIWERALGNALAISKDTYRICIARAKRSLASGSFPTTTLNLIDADIKATLPSLHIFHPSSGPLYQDLKDMLCAWVVSRSDEGLGYVQGASKIAGMFLLNMSPSSAFMAMRNLLERHCMRSFYGGLAAQDDVEAYYRIFDTLLADGMPKIYFNFKQHQLSPAAYLPDWLLSLFLDHLPLEACARIWDVFLLEGDAFLFRTALGILAVLEPRLFFPDRGELTELLRGENKAALEVAKRDGRALDGGKYDIYGIDEETLWERIEEMEDWWKESTWARLIQRELPDK